MKNNKYKGFTLLELMISVAILGVIAAVAVPAYTDHIKKAKRTPAKVELLRIAQMQESYFVQNLSYARDLTDTAGGLGLGANVHTDQNEYGITMTALDSGGGNCTGVAADSCASFTITATPFTNSSQSGDNDCPRFTISNTGQKGTAASASIDQVRKCWK